MNRTRTRPTRSTAAALAVSAALLEWLAPSPARAAEEAAAAGAGSEYVQVTATRTPEDLADVPVALTIVTGADLQARGVTDLRGALALVVGVDIAPAGDAGPAASVPEIMGLKEFDAFLLVVDGIPWGGAFNPDTLTLSMLDVDRIEVERGPTPVFYGTTSFVGVIHIIHRAPGKSDRAVAASAGNYSTGSLSFVTALPQWAGFDSSLSVEGETVGLRDDRAGWDRELFAWRNAREMGNGTFRLDLMGAWLQQDPGSPHPRAGVELSPDVPLDANHNPSDAKLDSRRITLNAGYSHRFSSATWNTTVSGSQSNMGTLRGFLFDASTVDPNANGFFQSTDTTDIFFDSHVVLGDRKRWTIVTGVDWLHGRVTSNGADFDYFVPLDGTPSFDADGEGEDVSIHIRDTRDFSGAYAQGTWSPLDWLRFDLGLRINRTNEDRTNSVEEAGARESGSDSRTHTTGSGQVGASVRVWHSDADAIHLWASYRDAFKPAAFDAGLDSETEILEPETARVWEGGARGAFVDGRLRVGLSGYQMSFENLVVSQAVNGLPALENAGSQRFRGGEFDASWHCRHDLSTVVTYARHDSRFRDYLTEFDGVPTQLAGNRLEMVPKDLASAGLVWSPEHGFFASTQINFVGARYLNKRNTALASQYTTWSAGGGYRWRNWQVRVDAENLNDQRPPVAESELGDAQYYRLPARSWFLSGRVTF